VSRVPSDAGRSRCVTFLESLIAHPPERFAQLDIQAGDVVIGSIPAEELANDADPESLFEEHVDEFAHVAGRVRYHARCRQEDGRIEARGKTCSWGLQRPTIARGARQAGGGGELAAASLGESSAASMRELGALVPKLAAAAAGQNAEQLAAMTVAQENALEAQQAQLTEMMRLQIALTELQVRAELDERPAWWESQGGQLVLTQGGTLVQALAPAVAEALTSWTAGRKLELRERELELRERELELHERMRAIHAHTSEGPEDEDHEPTAEA